MTADADAPQAGAQIEGDAGAEIKAVPARHPGRWVATVIVAYVVVVFFHGLITNPNFDWSVVKKNLFDGFVIRGVGYTLLLTFLSMIVGVALGTLLAVMRLSPVRLISGTAWVYIWFFRGTPVYVQLLFWGSIGALTGKSVALQIPWPFGIVLAYVPVTKLIPILVAAVLGLGLNEAAYMAEIVRAGMVSVGEGQAEAASSIGMTRMQALRLVVLPQAMRVIIPPTGNETIGMLKTTSLAGVALAVPDLTYVVTQVFSVTFQIIPWLLIAVIWYLILTSILTWGQFYVERYYARGSTRALPPTPLQRFRALFLHNLTTVHSAEGRAPLGPPPPSAAR
ncbi:MAG TPA: amino acid ABC transporter permease [Actinomycetota bacterium]|nr:amino acid ABC transporter permease [Actinomycetota bacterium]